MKESIHAYQVKHQYHVKKYGELDFVEHMRNIWNLRSTNIIFIRSAIFIHISEILFAALVIYTSCCSFVRGEGLFSFSSTITSLLLFKGGYFHIAEGFIKQYYQLFLIIYLMVCCCHKAVQFFEHFANIHIHTHMADISQSYKSGFAEHFIHKGKILR